MADQALAAKQAEAAPESIPISGPSLVDDLGELIEAGRVLAALQFWKLAG